MPASAPDIDVGRLCSSINLSRRVLLKFRDERRKAVQQYVGNHWSENGSDKEVPVNLLALYISVVSRNLISKDPRILFSTFDRPHKPAVTAMQSWANQKIEDMGLKDALERVAVDALFSIGILKVALAGPTDSAMAHWNLKAGEAFAAPIDFDDFVYDVHSRDFREVSYIGHRYRAPLDVLKGTPYYDRKKAKLLVAQADNPYNHEGDQRISTLTGGLGIGGVEEFEDLVDCWEIYLPRHRVVLTLLDDDVSDGGGAGAQVKPFRQQEWIGPATGPYHLLWFATVPGNAMPKAPVQDLIDLHSAVNRCYRKAIKQADRQKDLTFVQGAADADGNRIIQSDDGDVVKVDNPDRIKTVSMGGSNQSNLLVANALKDLFDFMAGNMSIMGGLGPQSKTLGQDKMLNENASRAITDMQDRMVGYVSGVFKALGWYWWNDPLKVIQTTRSVPGLPDITTPTQVYPRVQPGGPPAPGPLVRQAPFESLQLRADPYSLRHQTPEQKAGDLMQLVMQVVMPMMQLLQAQGIQLDANALMQKLAEYKDNPDFQEILTMQDAQAASQQGAEAQGGGDQGGPAKPANTTRTYERLSMPGRTDKGNNLNLMNALAGVNGGGNPNGSAA